MHGGATPRGSESPHFKHGLYSRFARGELAERIAALRQDEERLHDLREVLAVQGALLGEALEREDLGAAAALTEAVSRSIDRYHKHHPPEDGIQFLKIERRIVRPEDIHVTFGDDLTDPAAILAEIDTKLEALHRLGQQHPLEQDRVRIDFPPHNP